MTLFKIWAIIFLLLNVYSRDGFSAENKSQDLRIGTLIPIGEIKPFGSRFGIGANLVDILFPRLFRISPQGEILPALAQKLEWEDNGSTLRLTFSSDRWKDLENTLQVMKKYPEMDLSEGLANLKSFERVSNKEVVFKLKKFDRGLLTVLSQIPIVPVDESTEEFELEKVSAEDVSLKRHIPSPEKVNRIRIQVLPSSRRSLRELVAGNIDLLFLASESEFKILLDLPELQVNQFQSKMLYMVLENRSGREGSSMPWLQINQRLDRQSLQREIGIAQVEPAFYPVYEGESWWSPDLKNDLSTQSLPNNSPAQNRILSFLGKMAIERKVARNLRRQFEDMGIHLELENLSTNEFAEKIIQKKDFDLVLMPFNFKDTMMINYLVFHSPESARSSNFWNYRNLKLDRFLEKARYAQDLGEAKAAFTEAIRAMMEDPPGLFLFWLKTPIVYRKACSGFSLNSNDFFSSLKDVRCEPSAVN